jgi:hypothetical protein
MGVIPRARWLALGVGLALALFPPTVAAVTLGCLRDKIVEVAPDSYVTVDLRIRPNQSVNVMFGRPGGGDDVAEWRLQTDTDGRLRRSFSAGQIERTGQVKVTVTTKEPCARDDGKGFINVTVGSLPSTDTVGSQSLTDFAPLVVGALALSLLTVGRTRLLPRR